VESSGKEVVRFYLSQRPQRTQSSEKNHVDSTIEYADNLPMKEPMNIIFIFADQMHGFAMGCMGNADIKTPHLDKLAAEGILFRNTYTCFPVCTPFRGNLFTGRFASQTGIIGNTQAISANERTLADCFNDGGYRTSYVGKWHLGGKDNIWVEPHLRGGFKEMQAYQCYNDFEKQVWFFDEEGKKSDRAIHRTDATFQVAMEQLEKLKDSQFALFISEQAPHYPLQPSPEFEALYQNATIRRRPNCQEIDPYVPTASPPVPDVKTDPINIKYGNNLDQYLKLYYAMVTQVDHQVGKLMQKLEDLGIADKTAIIFTSDHGDLQGSHGEKNKNRFWEESVRIPFIASIPGGPRGIVRDELFSSVDFYPTLLDLAKIPVPASAEGISYAPFMLGDNQKANEEIFSEDKSGWLMIRRGDFKLVVNRKTFEATHLFDLSSDPYEMNNLVESSKFQSKRDELKQRLKAWHAGIMERKDPKLILASANPR
jgi:arylsulfatase A-like enzyme